MDWKLGYSSFEWHSLLGPPPPAQKATHLDLRACFAACDSCRVNSSATKFYFAGSPFQTETDVFVFSFFFLLFSLQWNLSRDHCEWTFVQATDIVWKENRHIYFLILQLRLAQSEKKRDTYIFWFHDSCLDLFIYLFIYFCCERISFPYIPLTEMLATMHLALWTNIILGGNC